MLGQPEVSELALVQGLDQALALAVLSTATTLVLAYSHVYMDGLWQAH